MARENTNHKGKGTAARARFNVDDDEILYPKTSGNDLASVKKRRESVRQRR